MALLRVSSLLRWSAGIVLIAIVAVWVATGAHRGWTKTEIVEMHRDEITGIDYPVQRPGFVAGVDLLGAGASVAAILFAGSWITNRRRAATGP
jgi:hypothetical protein